MGFGGKRGIRPANQTRRGRHVDIRQVTPAVLIQAPFNAAGRKWVRFARIRRGSRNPYVLRRRAKRLRQIATLQRRSCPIVSLKTTQRRNGGLEGFPSASLRRAAACRSSDSQKETTICVVNA